MLLLLLSFLLLFLCYCHLVDKVWYDVAAADISAAASVYSIVHPIVVTAGNRYLLHRLVLEKPLL